MKAPAKIASASIRIGSLVLLLIPAFSILAAISLGVYASTEKLSMVIPLCSSILFILPELSRFGHQHVL